MKLKHVRRGASDESRPVKRRRTSEVLIEIETAVTQTPDSYSVDTVHWICRARRCGAP